MADLRHSRRRKARTVFTNGQLNGLEDKFIKQKYLSTPERLELAEKLHLIESQVSFKTVIYIRETVFI